MSLVFHQSPKLNESVDLVIITNDKAELKGSGLSKHEIEQVKSDFEKKLKSSLVMQGARRIWVFKADEAKSLAQLNEIYRRMGNLCNKELNRNKNKEAQLFFTVADENLKLSFLEGLSLSNYQFLKYFKDAAERKYSLSRVNILSDQLSKKVIESHTHILDGVFKARTLVNEPVSYLTAEQLSKEIGKMAKEAGFRFEYFDKKKIIKNKMGGLLAVNRGSQDPPTFNILEWKPAKAKNKKPLVLIGKGVVYDTGGLSLKPTPNSMDLMKSDMAGAAAVAGVFHAIAMNKLPYHVIGLIPATDNRPGENAYTPGDVVHMHNGMTVEVLNTDAEGRMILADALSWAQQYKPELVIDMATLTGAAAAAIGPEGIVMMGKADDKFKEKLKHSSMQVHERLVEFPLWDEYGNYIKSDIADIKNVGGPYAGAITAGKFLEHFTKYDWIHLDIAGSAFLTSENSYKGKNATGVGVRLIYNFLSNL